MLLLLACAPREAPPDILLVTLDTTRADALACYGNTEAETPTLDRLAAEGVRFSRAYTTTPLTIPAHSSLHTGLYPPRHGVRDNGDFVLSDEAVTLAERAAAGGYATAAATGAEVTAEHWGFGQGFDDYYDDLSVAGARSRWQVERPADQVVDDALGWLAGRDSQEQPWFFWLHLFDVHSPYEPPEPYKTRFAERPYLGELAFVDAQLGRLLEGVDLSRTWVVVLADHGEGMGAHGELMHGVLLYNATTRVPLIVRPPGGGAARHVHFPVSLVDVMPTLLDLAGLPPVEGLDGMDLSPWLRPGAQPPAPAGRGVYVESLYAWRHYGWSSQRALVSAQWKLIDSTTPELYARSDYAEQESRAPTEPSTVEAMRQRVREQSAAEGLDGAAALSARQRAQLEALGYMASTAAGEGDGFEAGLPDPVGRLSVLAEVEAARLALQGGDLDEALRRIDAVLVVEPGLAAPRQLRAHVLWRQQQHAAALDELQQLRSSRPSAAVSVTMGVIELERGEVEAGLALLEEALEREPHLEGAWQPYLQALFLAGRLDALEAAMARAQQEGAAAGTAAVLSAAVRLRAGDVGSEAALEAAIGAHPEVPLGRSALAAARAAAGDPVAAEQLLLDEIALSPRAPMPRRLLVGLLAEQRRHAEQLEALEALERLEPPSTELLHARAQALFNLGRYEDSLATSLRCLEIEPGSARCKLLEANVLMKLGREAEAHAAHEAARALAGLP